MKKREAVFVGLSLLLSCAKPTVPEGQGATSVSAGAKAPRAADEPSEDAGSDAGSLDGGVDPLAPEPRIGRPLTVDLLFSSMGLHEAPPECLDAREAIHCLLDARYAKDEAARLLARGLFDRTGSVAGVDPEQTFDGGYRGLLHLVPVLPVGKERVHLERVVRSLDDYDIFFETLVRRGGKPIAYRWRAIALRFFRSVKARTPSAYASGWTVAYNVDGSLNKTDTSVRETMFHEIFHLNDAAHGRRGDGWSERALQPIYEKIVHACKASTPCLAKYAPNDTMVRGGTYYAFQPGNDVREYAAELAVRYYREERGALGQGPTVATPFKCTGIENAAAWTALVTELFGGIDLTPKCP